MRDVLIITSKTYRWESWPRRRGPGRPRTIFDMRAYKAQKARERRARLKEGKGKP